MLFIPLFPERKAQCVAGAAHMHLPFRFRDFEIDADKYTSKSDTPRSKDRMFCPKFHSYSLAAKADHY